MHSLARAVAFGLAISIVSFITNRSCDNLKSISSSVPQSPLTPPPYLFGIVWPILFVTTGFAWVRSGEKLDLPLSVVTALSCAWLVVYACLRWTKVSALILLATTSLVAYAAVSVEQVWLVPLALWTAFATYLNAYSALKQQG